MNLLLDTCTFLWLILGSSELSSRARVRIRDPGNDVYLSSVSTWEMALKCSLGRLRLPEPVDVFVIGMRQSHEIRSLDLAEEATLQLEVVPEVTRLRDLGDGLRRPASVELPGPLGAGGSCP